jgi:hypothetical protein
VAATEAATPDRTKAIEAARTMVATLDEEMDLADLEATTAGAPILGMAEAIQRGKEATLDMRVGAVVIRAMEATEEATLVAETVKRTAATTPIATRITRATRVVATALNPTMDAVMNRIGATTQDIPRCAVLILQSVDASHSL